MRWFERLETESRNGSQHFEPACDLVEDLSAPSEGHTEQVLRHTSALLEVGAIEKATSMIDLLPSTASQGGGRPATESRYRLIAAAVHAFGFNPSRALQVSRDEDPTDPAAIRAALLSIRSFSYALLGQTSQSLHLHREAERMLAELSLHDSTALAPAIAGQALLAFEQGDSFTAREMTNRARGLDAVSEVGLVGLNVMARLPEILESTKGGVLERSLRKSALPQWTSSVARAGAYLVWLRGLNDLADGLPGVAMLRVSGCHRFDDHLVCPPTVRAASWLMLGQSKLARDELSKCVALRREHNHRTAVSARLLSAVAHLDHDNRRAAQLVRSVRSMKDTIQSSVMLRFLPTPLASRASELLGEDVRPIARIERIDRVFDRFRVLSQRELAIFCHLNSLETLGEIAKNAYVSRNTVNAQSRAIYRKLGLSSRLEAIDLAVSVGLSPLIAQRMDTVREWK